MQCTHNTIAHACCHCANVFFIVVRCFLPAQTVRQDKANRVLHKGKGCAPRSEKNSLHHFWILARPVFTRNGVLTKVERRRQG